MKSMELGGKSDWMFGINIVFRIECCCSDRKLWYNRVRQIVKETIGVGVNEKAVLRFYKTALSFTSISIFPW